MHTDTEPNPQVRCNSTIQYNLSQKFPIPKYPLSVMLISLKKVHIYYKKFLQQIFSQSLYQPSMRTYTGYTMPNKSHDPSPHRMYKVLEGERY